MKVLTLGQFNIVPAFLLFIKESPAPLVFDKPSE